MLPLKDCRGYRSRYINALNRAVRALTPIAGRGIAIRQSAQGVVIEATTKATAASTPFRHRWQVTATSETQGGSTVWTLHVAPGSVWDHDDAGALQEVTLTPTAPVSADEDSGGWKVSPVTTGTLYVAEAAGVRSLKLGDPETETGATIVRIADIELTTGTPSTCIITQRQVGDFVLGGEGGGEEVPAAWMVRQRPVETSSGTIQQWQVYSPIWCAGRSTLAPSGMEARGWHALAVISGTIYAVLTWVGKVTESGTTWTPGTPTITNNISGVPADVEPVADDPETSTPEGKDGSRSVIVEIGTFEDDGTFAQTHVGAIVENAIGGGGGGGGIPDGTTIPGWVSLSPIYLDVSGSGSSTTRVLVGYDLLQSTLKWDSAQGQFIQEGDPIEQGEIDLGTIYVAGAPKLQGTATDPTERAYLRKIDFRDNGTAVGTDTTIVAWEREVVSHAQDHVDGVL